jgi:Flp pilus assembly protein TadG
MVDASGQDTTFQRAAGARTSVCGLRSQRGSALLETAICLPILLLVVLGGIDLTNAFRCKNSLDYITTQAAKCIVTHGCDPQALVAANAAGLTLNPANLTVTTDAGTATATASYLYQPFGPFFPRITLTARASAAQ